MRRAIILLPLVVLAACASPREQCINSATRDARVLANLITQTQGNLSRGYALAEHQEVRTLDRTCRGRNEDGSTFTYSCDEVETISRTVPVAIDLNAERAKLASLQERFAQTEARSNQAVAQCVRIHPE